MAIRQIVGSGFGPYIYDDEVACFDADGRFTGLMWHGSLTDGQHWIGGEPVLDENVPRMIEENQTRAFALFTGSF